MDPTNDVMTHITTGAVIVYGIEALKQWGGIPWVNEHSKALNRCLSGAAAAAVAFGINWSGDAASGWTIHIPPLAILLAGGWEWLKQLATQQIIFDGVADKKGPS